MQGIHVQSVFSVYVPLSLPGNFDVAALKAPFGFAVTDQKTLNFFQYRIQLYYFNNQKNDEEEAANCFTWGKGNPLTLHNNSVSGDIDGVSLHLKINHYLFDFRRVKERVVRIVVECFTSSQTIIQRGSSARLKLMAKKPKNNKKDEDAITGKIY